MAIHRLTKELLDIDFGRFRCGNEWQWKQRFSLLSSPLGNHLLRNSSRSPSPRSHGLLRSTSA